MMSEIIKRNNQMKEKNEEERKGENKENEAKDNSQMTEKREVKM